jgi:hypothetical protein
MRSTRRKLAVMTAVLNDSLLVPPPHLRCLCYLLKFLQTISKHESENKMSANNLAICFAPTLLRPPCSKRTHRNADVTSSALLNDLCTTVDTLKTMITYFQQDDSEESIVLMDDRGKMKRMQMMNTPSKRTPHKQRSTITPVQITPSPSIRTRRQSRSVSIPLPTFSSYDNTSSVLSVHARGLMDQMPYIMFLQIDTKEFYLTKSLCRHDISNICNVDMSETADGSSALVVNFQQDKKHLRIRVSTAAQAEDWTKTIMNLIKHNKISKKHVSDVETQLQGVHK